MMVMRIHLRSLITQPPPPIDDPDGNLTAVAAVGGSYIGVYTFDNLRVRGEAQVSAADNVIVLGELDGSDLAAYIIDSKGLFLETFAADFGKTNCPQD
jgi:hypothetical protein